MSNLELEFERVGLEVERLRLQPGDLLMVKVPESQNRPERLERIRVILAGALQRAGLENQVLVMPRDFEFSAVSG